jgi:hypothetical protein
MTNTHNIVVNGRNHEWAATCIDYREVADMAGRDRAEFTTITYSGGPEENERGSLRPDGEPVRTCEGMRFTAVDTGAA